jgi:hypothetical protein
MLIRELGMHRSASGDVGSETRRLDAPNSTAQAVSTAAGIGAPVRAGRHVKLKASSTAPAVAPTPSSFTQYASRWGSGNGFAVALICTVVDEAAVDDPDVDAPKGPETGVAVEASLVASVSWTGVVDGTAKSVELVELVEARVVGNPAGCEAAGTAWFRSPVIRLAMPTAAATRAKVMRNRLSNRDRCAMFITPFARGIVRALER